MPCLQAGNDFLPGSPSLEIYGRPSGLDVLLNTYKEQLPGLGGPITNGSVINMDRLKRMLTKLAEDEEDAFKRLAVRGLFNSCCISMSAKPRMYAARAVLCESVRQWGQVAVLQAHDPGKFSAHRVALLTGVWLSWQ